MEKPDLDPMPTCIDLEAFGKSMAQRDESIGRLIRAIKLAQACFTDIKGARDATDTLIQWIASEPPVHPDQSLTIQSALLSKGVILYARATHGAADNGGRGSIQIKASLPVNLKADHDLIIDLRNKAIAHSHPGKLIGDRIWEEQQLLLVETSNGFNPMHTTRTTQIDHDAIHRLDNLLNFAMAFYHQRFSQLSNKIVDKMHDAGFSLEELLTYAIDPTSYFPDVETFRNALANMPQSAA